jgi:hypothetical protein
MSASNVDALTVRLARIALELDDVAEQLATHRLEDADADLVWPSRKHLRIALDRLDGQLLEVHKYGFSSPDGRQRLRLAGDLVEHGAAA